MKKYYAYISEEVKGPALPEDLKRLPGFNRGTMVYPEDLLDGTPDDWKPAFQVAEFGTIPFASLKPPPFNPTEPIERTQSSHSSSPQNISSSTLDQSDIEKIKMIERIQHLEKQVKMNKNLAQENENLKLIVREKEQKLYEISQELKKLKEGTININRSNIPVTETVPSNSKPDPLVSMEYTSLDIPVLKLLSIGVGILIFTIIGWSFVPGSAAKKFLRRLFSGSVNAKSEINTQTVSIPSPTDSLNKQNVSEKSPEQLKNVEQVKSQSEPSREKERAEQKIFQKYRQLKSAKQKITEHIQPGISMNEDDPNFRLYLKAQDDYDLQEKEFKTIVTKYKEKYGETSWQEFNERAKKLMNE